MKIQSSAIEMTSGNLYTRAGYLGRDGGDFMRSLKDASSVRQGGLGSRFYSGGSEVRSGTSMSVISNDREMSPSDELSMRLSIFRYLIDLILKGRGSWGSGREQMRYMSPGESYAVWNKTERISGFSAQLQETAFESRGLVRTEDGREIDFGISFAMSEAFVEEFKIETTVPYVMADPLVINLGSSVTRVSDKKFLFDLDCDGKKEELSFAGEGCGFLALDKNGDGIINDGNELFGTRSGDGFSDLAVYDEDKNGWIDENDSVFERLKVWTKNDNGEDVLLNLKDADVGAIYLQSVPTEFSMYDGTGSFAGMMRRSGIFLHESSALAGTVSHLDLAY